MMDGSAVVRVMCDLALRGITKDGQMPIFFADQF
jgi:hypothetical protein